MFFYVGAATGIAVIPHIPIQIYRITPKREMQALSSQNIILQRKKMCSEDIL
ncbi:MAG: hypothetical protein ACI4V3_04155 [Faecousia sp.]